MIDQSVVAREQALVQVEDHADPEFKIWALDSVLAVAQIRSEFTTDEVVEFMNRVHPNISTHELRAWGPIMRTAARSGWIENTGRVRESNMVVNHRRPKAIWRSTVRKHA